MFHVGGEKKKQTETCVMSALNRPAAELTVTDVYDIAAVLGQEFERVIDRFGCECLVGVVPRVVRVLELLETLVGHGARGQEAEELRRELDRLNQDRSDRFEQEKKHQMELEQVEDMWRGEVQDLLSQITQLQTEKKKMSVRLSLKESSMTEEDLHKQEEGIPEQENQVMKKLEDLVDKQRDEIQVKDHLLSLRNEDVEAFQMQQHRLIRINQDLLHRLGVMEAQGKTLIQQKAELEAAAHAQQQEYKVLQQEVMRLTKELQEREVERELAEIEEFHLSRPVLLSTTSPQTTPVAKAPANSVKPKSVWAECGGDPSFVAKCLGCDKSLSLLPKSTNREINEDDFDEDATTQSLRESSDAEPEQDTDSQDTDKPRFTLQELWDILEERNELKAKVFVLQEELAHYKSEESDDDTSSIVAAPSHPPESTSNGQPESGIKRLIFTAIMPMVAAGLITDDPTLMPIRRLVSFI